MLSFLSLPAKIVSILEGNISPREIALGVCLGAFLGFIPLNGPMALLLAVFFFFFRINRVATLLTLPIFKAAYILGLYRLADVTGIYILEKADYLAGFWRWVTHLPIVSYLDINNTLITGGIVIAAALSMPLYFVAKRSVIILSAKYSEKIKNSPLAKWIPGIKLMGLIRDDTRATLKNVKTQIKLDIKARIRAAIARRKTLRKPNELFKRINVVRVIFVVTILLVFHLAVGLIISPAFSSFIVENINKYSSAKITVDRVNIWPLTLSFSLKGMKIFDPERPDVRIARIDDSVVGISPLGLLSKRFVFSRINMKGAEINLEGTPDGSFNIRGLVPVAKETPGPDADAAWRSLMQRKDLFGRIYEMIKKHFSKKDRQKTKEKLKTAKRVTKTVDVLPKGRLVHFKNARDLYIFEIKNLDISDAYVRVKMNGDGADIKDAKIRLSRLAYDPINGMRLDLLDLRGDINKGGKSAGRFDISFSKNSDKNGQKAVFKARLNDIDMDTVRFVYEDSLPVHVVKGYLTLKSKTYIEGGAINSTNEVYLKGHALEPKAGGSPVMGLLPIAAVCEAMNRIDPLKLKFNIGGTVEKPEFGGFQESLMALIKPYIANFQERIKGEGLKAIGRFIGRKDDDRNGQAAGPESGSEGSDLGGVVDSLKSLFGDKKE